MGWVKRVIENVKARGLKDVLNPSKWHVFLQGEAIKEEGIVFSLGEDSKLELTTEEDIIAYCEQFIYRQAMCPKCVELKKCVHCKCKVPGNMLTPTNQCSNGAWMDMMSTEEWTIYKQTLGIKFNISFIN